MTALERRGARIAQNAQRAAMLRLRARLAAALPAADVAVGETAIEIKGRNLLRRWLADSALRFLMGGGR